MTELQKVKLLGAAEEWVSALESGMFAQTKGDLQNDGGYCCLGVACAVAPEDVEVVLWSSCGPYHNGAHIRGGNLDVQDEVMDWVGLLGSEGEFLHEEGHVKGGEIISWIINNVTTNHELNAYSNSQSRVALVELNDSYGLTFPELAKVIRHFAQYLFLPEFYEVIDNG